MTIDELKTELLEASNGLLMLSETDEPFEFFHEEELDGEEFSEATVLKMAGMPAQYPVEVVELDYFFRNQTRALEENPEAEERAKRFQELQAKLKELLQGVKVFRVGEVSIKAYILGTTEEGKIAGLTTMVVET